MIHDVDNALRALLEREALTGSGDVDVSFEAPTTDWASRRGGPAVNVYLYDIREDTARRSTVYGRVHDDEGLVTAHRQAPRRFRLAYLLTCWTQRPEDEHRLLASCLSCFLRHETLPPDLLGGSLAGAASLVTVALPTQERAISEIWTALGGELKPSLELHINAPFDVSRERPAAAPVLEEPALRVATADGTRERPRRPLVGTGRRGPVPLAARLRAGATAEMLHGSGARLDVELDPDGDADAAGDGETGRRNAGEAGSESLRPGRWLRTSGPG